MGGEEKEPYFTEFTFRKGLLYFVAALYVFSVTAVSVVEPVIRLPCDDMTSILKYANPVYDGNPCRAMRFPQLLWLTREECSFCRRLISAAVLGGIIGWERRQADRPAGIRTMSLVSLGSSLFTICSTFAFLTGQNEWDASRISAAIPSGVGFLGAGLIFKEQSNNVDGAGPTHVVHGLTTATSLWLSAAVGIACGGELYFAASFGTAIMLLLLRFGPRSNGDEDEDEDEDNSEAVDLFQENMDISNYGTRGGMLLQDHSEKDSLVGSSSSSLDALVKKQQGQRKRGKASLATEV